LRTVVVVALALVSIASLAGCSLAPTVKQNTHAIGHTNETVADDTRAVGESTGALGWLAKHTERSAALQEPLRRLADLGPTFQQLAALNDPLRQVTELKPERLTLLVNRRTS
jgi:hypothetical protein